MFPFLVALASDGIFLGILVFSFLAGQCQLPEPGKWKSQVCGGKYPLGSHAHAEWGTDPAPSLRASHLAPLVTGRVVRLPLVPLPGASTTLTD